jgi:hypothetical protein
MDIRDLSWEVRPAGDTLMQEIEALGKKLDIPADRRRDIRWLAENLRTIAGKDDNCCCEHKVLISYVQTALLQGINWEDDK